MNRIISKVILITFILVNGFVKISHASPKNPSILESLIDEANLVTVESVDLLMDGGSIMFECAANTTTFKIVFQRPQKKQLQSFVRVLTVEDVAKPNLMKEILPDSPEEMRLLSVFSGILKRRSSPKFEREIKTAIKYISNREVAWATSDWIVKE